MYSDQPTMPSSVVILRNELARHPASQCRSSILVIFIARFPNGDPLSAIPPPRPSPASGGGRRERRRVGSKALLRQRGREGPVAQRREGGGNRGHPRLAICART